MARGLGKGIEAFFPAQEDEESVQEIKISELRVNPYQPRKSFSEEAIAELRQSIEIHGVLQPLIVRKSIKGYEIVVGERRFRASQQAGLKTVPVVVKELSDEQMMEIALIENLQREDLNPVEEAYAYRKLMSELNYTQEELSKRVGKSRPHIANHIRLLSLPENILSLIAEGKLSMGHGRTLLSLKNEEKMHAVANKVVKEKMNVRDLEKLIQRMNNNVPRETLKAKRKKDLFLEEKETVLRNRFGTNVTIKRMKQKGKIEIEFLSDEDLERVLTMLEA